MIDRVFAFEEAPCHCHFADPATGDSIRAPIAKISRAKAIVETPVNFPKDKLLPTELEFPDGRRLVLGGMVADSGRNFLFLRWNHTEKDSEARLATMLVEMASSKWPVTQSSADSHDGSGAAGRTRHVRERTPALAVPDLHDIETARIESVVDETLGLAATGPAAPKKQDAGGLRESILRKSRTVRSLDLAATHVNVQVLNMTTILALIEEAVKESLATSELAFDEEERKKLLSETEQTFKERLVALSAQKAGADSQIENLQAQLARAQKLLDEEKARVVSAEQFTVSDAGIVEMEKRLGRLFDRSLKAGEFAPDAVDEMRDVVLKLLDSEREKIVAKAREAQNDAIALLEKKIGRLATTLDGVTGERDSAQERARMLEAAGGNAILKSLYTAGLKENDPNKGKKLELLKELVAFNKEVRDHMIAQGTLPQKSVALGGAAASPAAGTPPPAPGGVKKINVKDVAPPPLERTTG